MQFDDVEKIQKSKRAKSDGELYSGRKGKTLENRRFSDRKISSRKLSANKKLIMSKRKDVKKNLKHIDTSVAKEQRELEIAEEQEQKSVLEEIMTSTPKSEFEKMELIRKINDNILKTGRLNDNSPTLSPVKSPRTPNSDLELDAPELDKKLYNEALNKKLQLEKDVVLSHEQTKEISHGAKGKKAYESVGLMQKIGTYAIKYPAAIISKCFYVTEFFKLQEATERMTRVANFMQRHSISPLLTVGFSGVSLGMQSLALYRLNNSKKHFESIKGVYENTLGMTPMQKK